MLAAFKFSGVFMASATYKELLKENRDFRRLWTGQVISELGNWFSFIAELGIVRLLSGSALATTALMAARMLPFLLVAPIAGVVADRLSRKRIMITTDLLRAGLALVYIPAAAFGRVWIVILSSFVMLSLTMFFDAAKNAATPNIVTTQQLLTANVLMLSNRFLQYTLGIALGAWRRRISATMPRSSSTRCRFWVRLSASWQSRLIR